MYRLAYVYQFVMIASIGAVFVFLSDIRELYGLPEWGIGLIASMGFLVVLPVTFLMSPLADKGLSGPLIVGSMAFAVGGNLLFGFGNTLWHFVASRALLGVAIGIGGIAIRKSIIGRDIEGSGKKLGALLSVSVAGFILGPPLGSQLERFGFATVFIVFAVASVLVGLPLINWAWKAPVSTSHMTLSSVVSLLKKPRLRAAVLGYTVLFGAVGVFDSVVDIYLEDLGATNTRVGIVLLIIGAPLVFVPAPAGAFVERSNVARIFVLGMSGAAFSVAGYGLFPSLITFTIAGLLHSTIEGFTFTSCQVLTVRETGASESAAGQALLESFGAVSAGAAAFMGPVVYEAVGPRVLYLGYGAIILTGAMAVKYLLDQADNSYELAPADPVVA